MENRPPQRWNAVRVNGVTQVLMRGPSPRPHRDTRWGPRRNSPATSLAAGISWAVEDIGKAGRSFIAFHDTVHESQDAVEAVDPSALAQHGAIRLVAVDHRMLEVHRTIEGIDPTTQ